MDEYTLRTKNWLEERFKKIDNKGYYLAHQPIYGYKKGPSEPNVIAKYIRTFQILKRINRLKFDSLLEVGCAEGYLGNIVKKLYKCETVVSDLSHEACLRAKQLYNLKAVNADVQRLPFKSKSFDLTICSETLEHVFDLPKAIAELERVTAKYLIITVPYKKVSSQLSKSKEKEPHAHLHKFDFKSSKALFGENIEVLGIRSKLLLPISLTIEGPELPSSVKKRYPWWLIKIYNLYRNLSHLFGLKSVSRFIKIDNYLIKSLKKFFCDLLAIKKFKTESELKRYSDKEILNFLLVENFIPKEKFDFWPNKPLSFEKNILNRLVCPLCGSDLKLDNSFLKCKNCQKKYLIRKTIPELID